MWLLRAPSARWRSLRVRSGDKTRCRTFTANRNRAMADPSAIETGKYDPSLPLAFRLARLFGMRIEEIFLDEG